MLVIAWNIEARIFVPHFFPGAVAFQVSFINDVKAVLVTEPVKEGLVRVVRAADSIDVASLHGLDVPDHILFRDSPAQLTVKFVPVDPLEDDPLAVKVHNPVF